MLAAIPPSFPLAALLILLATQVAYVVSPRQPPYLVRLGVSCLVVLVAELAASAGLGQSLAVGNLHPVIDLALLAVSQWLVGLVGRREQTV